MTTRKLTVAALQTSYGPDMKANIAKTARKERKGERRSRGSEPVKKARSDSKKDTAKAIAGKERSRGKGAAKGKAIAKQPTSKKPGMKGGLKRGAPSARGKQK